MSFKLRILTFHYIPNNGAFLFAYSLTKLLQSNFPDFDIRITDYKAPRLAFYEFLKQFKPVSSTPLFYYKRYKMWNKLLREFLVLDTSNPNLVGEKTVQKYLENQFDALTVGMDVWCVIRGTERPQFPNIYWLPYVQGIPKIAYAVSAYNSDLSMIYHHRNEISSYLDGFPVIAARDHFTHNMVMKYRNRTDGLVDKIPDPTLLTDFPQPKLENKLSSIGIDLDRPILGLLFSGDDEISHSIQSHYHSKDYQIVALSMHNRFADFNLGHLLDPFEWACIFRYFNICVTNRFHGTIFCLKNLIPFLCLESDRHLSQEQSKLYDLLTDFDMQFCYENPADDTFSVNQFLSKADEIEADWGGKYNQQITTILESLRESQRGFIDQMKALFGW